MASAVRDSLKLRARSEDAVVLGLLRVRISVAALRMAGATGWMKDRGRPGGRMRFSFPDTAEGDNARQILQESFQFGTRGVIPARFIDEITRDVPSGFGMVLDGDLVIGPSHARQADDVSMTLEVFDQRQTVLARRSLILSWAAVRTYAVEWVAVACR